MGSLTLRSLTGLPEVRRGDDLAALIVAAARTVDLQADVLRDDEIVVISQKAVSKAEGAIVSLADVTPTRRAIELAAAPHPGGVAKDPRAVQVVLDESTEIVRAQRGVLICRTRNGLVCANAGVDASNAAQDETVILLPKDPDASAKRLRARLRELTGAAPGILITDSFGRAWRHGQCDIAIGCAGLLPLEDWRGRTDARGRELLATWLAVADALAAAADLTRAKDSKEPVVLVSGLGRLVTKADGPGAVALVRPLEDDLFR